jgi:hypothetical protein
LHLIEADMKRPTQIDKDGIHYLNVVKSAKPKLRRALLLNSDSKHIDALAQCCINFLAQSFRVAPAELRKLAKYKKAIRSVADSETSSDRKREIFVQRGNGFLPLLLPAAISLLTSILLPSK